MIFTFVVLVVAFILLLCMSVVALKLAYDFAKNKGRFWGVNLQPVNCPKCGQKTPYLRAPTSSRQERWGGWTCSGCGIEMDRWGTDISSETTGPSRQLLSPLDERYLSPVERVIHDKE